MHILIVEDDFASRKLPARSLRDLGVVDQAANGYIVKPYLKQYLPGSVLRELALHNLIKEA
jgi:DNA-binding response OmpR family regulator